MVPLAVRTLRATSHSELLQLASELHDSWIELPADTAYASTRSVEIAGTLEFGSVRRVRRYGPFVRVEESKPRFTLTVDNVLSVGVEDADRIGSLNVAQMEFNEDSSELVITGHVPTALCFKVSSLAVQAVITDEIAERRERWRLSKGARETEINGSAG